MSNKLPAFNAFTVKDRGPNKKAFWIRIGAAWPTESGEGINLQLDTLPLDGKIVLVGPRTEDETDDDGYRYSRR